MRFRRHALVTMLTGAIGSVAPATALAQERRAASLLQMLMVIKIQQIERDAKRCESDQCFRLPSVEPKATAPKAPQAPTPQTTQEPDRESLHADDSGP